MTIKQAILAIVSGILFPFAANALFIVSSSEAWVSNVTTAGGEPTYSVSARVQIVAVDYNDPTPNPCYQVQGCKLRFTFANAYSGDKGWPADDTYARTLGGFASNDTNKKTIFRSFVVSYIVPVGEKAPTRTPCVAIVPTKTSVWGQHQQINGLPWASNCSYGFVPVSDCKFTPASLDVSFGSVSPDEVSTREVITPFSLQCTPGSQSSVVISTGTGEQVPMNNSARTYAELNWGAGYGKQLKTTIKDNVSLNLKTRLVGFTASDLGEYSGSAVVYISYQ